MPKMKATDLGIEDLEELENAEFEKYNKTYTKYEGEIPPDGLILTGYVKKMWHAFTQQDEKPMVVVLWEAAENTGKNAQYNGLPIWERMALTKAVKFKWFPFFESVGLSIRAYNDKMYVTGSGPEDDEPQGIPIEKIGTWKPGEENEGAWNRIVTAHEFYKKEKQARVGDWLPWDSEAIEESHDEPETDEPEDTVEPEETEEPEEQEEAPAGRRGARKAPATASKTAAARTGRGARAATTPTRGAKSATGRRGSRTAAAADGDDPPF